MDETLRILDNTQGLIRTIFLGLSLNYKSLDLQRQQILAQAEGCPWEGLDPREVQTAASLITLSALFGFQKQSEALACQEALAGGCPDMMDVKLGAVIILVSLIRLIRILNPPQESTGEAGLLGDLEEDAADAEL